MPDDLAATLAEAQRIADGLGFACRLPGKTPDFTACGGPAAEAYWRYFTPARVSSLLAAIEAALKAADGWKYIHSSKCAQELREAITRELAGEETRNA